MERIAWKRVSRQWPVWFCAAVIAWFVISAMGVPERVKSFGDTSSAATSTSQSSPVNVDDSLQVGVRSFYLENDGKSPTKLSAKLTLEVVNGSGSNTEFRPGDLKLTRSGGQGESPSELRARSIQVAPTVPVLTTVKFPVEPAAGGRFAVTYAGRQVFEGTPG